MKATKVFKKPGQKKVTPEKQNALRLFYGSLFKENSKSRMARMWLVEHGCLSAKKAELVMLELSMEKLTLKNKK
jgi:hypothetical protein